MQSVAAYTRERRRAKLIKRLGRCWQLYLLLIPAVVYIFVFNYMPLYGIQIAFRDYSPRKGYWNSPWVGWKYFERFFSSPDCWNLIRNTLTLSIYSLVVGFPLPIVVALMLNQCNRTGFKKLVQNAIYAPHFVSMVVRNCLRLLLRQDMRRTGEGAPSPVLSFGWRKSDIVVLKRLW